MTLSHVKPVLTLSLFRWLKCRSQVSVTSVNIPTNQLKFLLKIINCFKDYNSLRVVVTGLILCFYLFYAARLSGWPRIIFCLSPRRCKDRSQWYQRSPRNCLVRETLLTWVFRHELQSFWKLIKLQIILTQKMKYTCLSCVSVLQSGWFTDWFLFFYFLFCDNL